MIWICLNVLGNHPLYPLFNHYTYIYKTYFLERLPFGKILEQLYVT